MSLVVLDSGIFIASVYVETLTAQAKGLLQQLQDCARLTYARIVVLSAASIGLAKRKRRFGLRVAGG